VGKKLLVLFTDASVSAELRDERLGEERVLELIKENATTTRK